MGDDIPLVDDPSRGWEAVAETFARVRSDVGADVVTRWAGRLRPGGSVLDLGCGTGEPVSRVLAGLGFDLYGLDPSRTMLSAYRHSFPGVPTVSEAAETSGFFDRRFDGIVAIGLLFLLPEEAQRAMIARVGRALEPGGHFLFSAPRQPCRWNDVLTGRESVSLGETRYQTLLAKAGLRVVGRDTDAGANDYLHAVADPS